MERTYIAIDDPAMTTSRNDAITAPGAVIKPSGVSAQMRLLFQTLPV